MGYVVPRPIQRINDLHRLVSAAMELAGGFLVEMFHGDICLGTNEECLTKDLN